VVFVVNYSIISNKEGLISIENDWRRLAERFKNPLLDFDWFSAGAEAFNSNEPLSIFIIKNGSQISAIAPLADTIERDVNKLELIGSPFLGEPGGLLYSDQSSLEMLLRVIIRKKKPIFLRRLQSNSPETDLVKKMHITRSICRIKDGGSVPWISINTNWDDYLEGLSSRRRYDLRRAEKRANEFGRVEVEVLSPKVEDLEKLLQEIYLVEATGWKGDKGSAILKKPRLKNFFSLYSTKAASQNMLRLGFLRIEGKSVAVLLGVQYAKRFWVLKIGYNEYYSKCSPGILLIHHTIRYAFDNRLEAYEFLGWDQPWIHMWNCQLRHCVSPLIYPYSLSGGMAFTKDVVRYVEKKIKFWSNHVRSE